jgi:Type II secretion system (T2SS), protein G
MVAACAAVAGFCWWTGGQLETRELVRWYPNGNLASVEWRGPLGRDGLCLYWSPLGELDLARSAHYGPIGRPQTLDAAAVAPWERGECRTQLELRTIQAAIESYSQQHARAPHDLLEVRDAGLFAGSISVPRDAWGALWNYRTETSTAPARVWSLGADQQLGGLGSAEDLACEFTQGAPACQWRGTLER